MPGDNVPYADYDAPVDSDNPKDSSATAIVASALFELFELTGMTKLSFISLNIHRVIVATTPTSANLYPIARNSSLPACSGDPIYLEKAQVYLSSLILASTYFDPSSTDGWEALLRKSTAAWGEPSTGSVTGDYFLLETMVSTASGRAWASQAGTMPATEGNARVVVGGSWGGIACCG